MALLEKQLVVKRSAIPNSGKGLFTKKFIPKGTRIVEYKERKQRGKMLILMKAGTGTFIISIAIM